MKGVEDRLVTEIAIMLVAKTDKNGSCKPDPKALK